MWELLASTGMHIKTLHETPWLCRDNDCFLMREIIEKTEYDKRELKAINSCRMHLNVITLLDITEGNGLKITADEFMGVYNSDCSSTWNWPNIPSPPKQYWDLWSGALKTTFLRPSTRYLTTALGDWTRNSHQRWVWFVSDNDTNLYEV